MTLIVSEPDNKEAPCAYDETTDFVRHKLHSDNIVVVDDRSRYGRLEWAALGCTACGRHWRKPGLCAVEGTLGSADRTTDDR